MWHLAAEPSAQYRFVRHADASDYACSGLSELTSHQSGQLENFLKDRLPTESLNLGVTGLAEHHIDVGQHAPIRQRCYLVSPKVQEAIRQEVDEMLEAGVIKPSESEWSKSLAESIGSA
ncbi:uncharacterized protein LOC116853501 [Odontomachus brunneus]|uniref:uncharacterized protein LOC116853501 n=1 Tax=Odontomachus brunneus TaxID=486640 RepID=UPI0013F187A1|nr:uncharacterized protein LOC116853501 [Odontomachus brunneus]